MGSGTLFRTMGISLLLTFVIPTMQWFVDSIRLTSTYGEIVPSVFIIVGASLWYLKTNPFSFLPPLRSWKIFCVVGSLSTLVLVFIDIANEPISQITGQARCAVSVVNVVVLLPLAEELIFRGHMWSFFEKVSVKRRFEMTLLGTSFLFGVGHIGYWLLFYWPLPIDAVLHSLLMIFAGLCFGFFRWISDSLWVPMIVHTVANGIVLIFQ